MTSERPPTISGEPRSLLRRYGTAVVAVGLATLIRTWLQPWLGEQFPTPTFFVAAMVTAWYAGFGPALLALSLGAISASYFFIPPARHWGSVEASYVVGLSVYLLVGLITIAFSESLRRARDAARRAEQAVKEHAEQLRSANEATHRFLAVLGHELRNPLATLSNVLFALEQGAVDPVGLRHREIMQRQVRQLTRLADDLLDVTRISQGRILLKLQRLDLIQQVCDVAEDCRGLYEEAGVILCVEVPDEAVWVDGDPARLAQVLGNLLRNAVKFTDAGGQVTIGLAQDGHWATLTVRDTGIGIAPEILDRVFDPFAQEEGNRERSSGGLGLGLALVKGLVELHRGEVRVSSNGPGCGTEFTVRLRQAQESGRP